MRRGPCSLAIYRGCLASLVVLLVPMSFWPGSALTSQGSGPAADVRSDRVDLGAPQPLCRYGVDDLGDISDYPTEDLRVGWYWNWRMAPSFSPPAGVEFLPTVRLRPSAEGGYELSNTTLAAVAETAAKSPGMVWIIGNEPDSIYQDNLEPSAYAAAYHDLYSAIKASDPTARVANGGIVQVTPVRLLYLDLVLQSYAQLFGEPMPIDVWNIHIYVLPERSCQVYPEYCWGAEIPPGIEWAEGMLYTMDDNANLQVFRQMVSGFRAWMASRGYSDRPLIITEFGVQMPVDFGFTPECVNAYMTGAFDFLRTTTGADGYPQDGHRLVQRWAWWSLQRPIEYLYSNGWLYDPGHPPIRTAVGDNYAAYTAQIEPEVNLFPVRVQTEQSSPYSPSDPVTVTLSVLIANDGEVQYAGGGLARVYLGLPGEASQQVGSDLVIAPMAGCGASQYITVTVADLSPGSHPIYVVVDPDSEISERDEADNTLIATVLVATERVALPMVLRERFVATSSNEP